jgi:hypothetical protein
VDSVDGEVVIDVGTGFDVGSELPEPEAMELMEEDAPGPAKRSYSREQLDVLERESFGGTMKNADIAAAITRLTGGDNTGCAFVEGQCKEATSGGRPVQTSSTPCRLCRLFKPFKTTENKTLEF